jgi:hypothetical protein
MMDLRAAIQNIETPIIHLDGIHHGLWAVAENVPENSEIQRLIHLVVIPMGHILEDLQKCHTELLETFKDDCPKPRAVS